MVRLEKPLKREVHVGDVAYTVTIDPDGLKFVRKGRRNGVDLRWSELDNGDAALAAALQASLRTVRD